MKKIAICTLSVAVLAMAISSFAQSGYKMTPYKPYKPKDPFGLSSKDLNPRMPGTLPQPNFNPKKTREPSPFHAPKSPSPYGKSPGYNPYG